MKISAFHAAIAGVVACAAAAVVVVHPSALRPHADASPVADHVVLDATPAVRAAPPDGEQPHSATVYVAGAVARPGVYTLHPGARANDAILRAGGLRGDADSVAVNLAARVEDGQEIAVPRIGERLAGVAAGDAETDAVPALKHRRSSHAAHRRRRRRPDAESAGADLLDTRSSADETAAAPVDLNTAGVDALASLPGVGETLAERIVAFRQLNGPFATVDGLADVSGMTERRVEAIEPLVSVSHDGAMPR